jgi:hypothetical protein
MFRGLPEHRVLQVATRADDLRPLIPARD